MNICSRSMKLILAFLVAVVALNVCSSLQAGLGLTYEESVQLYGPLLRISAPFMASKGADIFFSPES